jgi:malate/lactate dehydrogenase
MKISVIGAAGCVGSSIAFNIARQGLADELMVGRISAVTGWNTMP